MRDVIHEALKKRTNAHVEIRIEEKTTTSVRFKDREIEEVSLNTSLGGSIRALVGGGWGFVSFNDINNLDKKVDLAINQATIINAESLRLSDRSPLEHIGVSDLENDATAVPLHVKTQVLDEYAEIMGSNSAIQTSSIHYKDAAITDIFASNDGTYIEQRKADLALRLSALARNGGDVQQSGVSLGSNGDFSFVRKLHSDAQAVSDKAVELLAAKQLPAGEYTVVLDPILAGVFIHEAFGHLSEADHVYENEQLREIMRLGKKFSGKHLNVVDGALIPNLRGSYEFDDEGTPSSRTYLIREGELVGRLHSRETAARMNEKPTGNARSISHSFPPIVRMTNTFIEPGSATFEELISGIDYGVYAQNWYGGMTSMEMFTFSAGEANVIRNGKIEETVRPVMLSGNVFKTLEHLDCVGNDLAMNQGGGCGKQGQSPLPVSNGSPHIRIQQCLVGGA